MKRNPFWQDLECPKCECEFEAEVSWNTPSGECPECGNTWQLDEVYDSESGNTFEYIDWE